MMRHFLLSVCTLIFLTDSAHAGFLKEIGETTTPIGYIEMCQRDVQFCLNLHLNTTGERSPEKITYEKVNLLEKINQAVNWQIIPVTDINLYGRVEFWTLPKDNRGDCEDYALLKMVALIKNGWPGSTLHITVVKERGGEGHAVLAVETTDGTLILDNKNQRIVDVDIAAEKYLFKKWSYGGSWRLLEHVSSKGISTSSIPWK